MAKVVYNACFGGYSLSREAILLGRDLSRNPMWAGPSLIGDKADWGIVDSDYGPLERDNPARHDPILVKVIEVLGERANGPSAKLKIEEVGSQCYRIEVYDGRETVEVCYGWINPLSPITRS